MSFSVLSQRMQVAPSPVGHLLRGGAQRGAGQGSTSRMRVVCMAKKDKRKAARKAAQKAEVKKLTKKVRAPASQTLLACVGM